MKLFKNIYLPFIVMCGMLASCSKNFDEINTDPNRPKEVNPGVMLGQMQYRIVNSSIGGARDLHMN